MGVKTQPRALLAQGRRASSSRRWPNAKRAAASAARSRSSSARSRRASPTTSAGTSQATGADAVVLGDLGCMLNIEGRLRRRGDARDAGAARRRSPRGRASSLTREPRRTSGQPCKSPRCISRRARTTSCNDARLQANLQQAAGQVRRRSGAASIAELDDFEGTREAGEGDPPARARRPRRLARAVRARTRRRAARRCCGPRRRPTSTRWCSRSRRGMRVRKIIKSKSMVSEESALDHAIEAAGLTVVETDLGEYILQINDYEPPSHIIGPALHKSKEEVAELFHQQARHAAEGRHRGAVPRGARRPAPALPDRRHGHLRRQLLRRRDRLRRARHQRRQRDADDDAAEGARRDLRHREDRAHARGRRHADAPAAALGDRPVDLATTSTS